LSFRQRKNLELTQVNRLNSHGYRPRFRDSRVRKVRSPWKSRVSPVSNPGTGINVPVPTQQRVEKPRLALAQIKTRIYGKNGEVPDRLFQLETLVPGQDEKQMSDWVAGAILASRKLPQFLTPMARGLPKTVRPGRLRAEV
jgi:hypothetical protein